MHLLLFVLTLVSTTLVGASHYVGFKADFNEPQFTIDTMFFLRGLWYSLTILAILGCHELGHYLACRYYNVDASLPFFIPMPIFLTGTMGAFIRIREPIPLKRQLFDIGIAGPIAGFVVAMPLLFMGVAMSHVAKLPPDFQGLELGEPLLFKATSWLLWGTQAQGYSVNMHPMAFGAWFGLIATALNLIPIGQLDGGHISYAVLGRRSSDVTVAALGVVMLLSLFVSTSWLVWTILMGLLLLLFGRHHPRVYDEEVPLDSTRLKLAVFALFMLVVCFTPAPIEPMELIRGS